MRASAPTERDADVPTSWAPDRARPLCSDELHLPVNRFRGTLVTAARPTPRHEETP
jgi:hypothetical protein